MRKQHKGYLFFFFSLVALLVGLPGTSMEFAKASTQLASHHTSARLTGETWSIISSPNVGPYDNQLSGVAVVSLDDAWAVGYSLNNSYVDQTLIEHWNGRNWSVVSSPNVGSGPNDLSGIAAVSASNIWAVGGSSLRTSSATLTLIEHWNGTSWSVVPSPNVTQAYDALSSVAVVSANDVWAVGSYANSVNSPTRTLIEHWNGSTWSVVSSPNVGLGYSVLYSVAAASANNIWAVGVNGYTQTLIEHWNGSTWSVVPSPNVGSYSNYLESVAVVSPSVSDVWAVGYTLKTFEQVLIEHWNGSQWSIVPGYKGNSALYGVTQIPGSSNLWAVGNYYINNDSQTLIEQWNGTNWRVVSSPNASPQINYLIGVGPTPDSNNVWAVGYYEINGVARTLIEHCC